MHLFTHLTNLKSFLEINNRLDHKIAFIPTMGALHQGHVSLIEIGKKYADVTVCSIYVNPNQFNNKNDLSNYPRSLEKDAFKLETVHCDVLFVPVDEEIYPPGLDTEVSLNLGKMDLVMEGHFRPGHFKGMLQVVKRLLDLVNPHYLIMGQKDFQQFSLVQQMINQLHLPVKLIMAPTLRDFDGLALSSRNQRLTIKDRSISQVIYQSLLEIKSKLNLSSTEALEAEAMETLKLAGLKPEYVEIVDGYTLQKIVHPEKHEFIVACIAAWAGEVRLIDNIILKGNLA